MADTTVRFPYAPIQPGAYSIVDTSALQRAAAAPFPPVVAIVGDTTGGKPNTPLFFSDAQAAKNVLRSGGALDMARLAVAGGAARVCVVRAGTGVLQSSKALTGATSSPVTLTSIDYGAWTTNIKVTVTATNVVTISYVDVRGVTFTETFNGGASATPQSLVDLINGKVATQPASAFVTATVTAGTLPLTPTAISPLATGSDGSALAAGDWTTALTALETQDVDIVVAATGDATVHAQVQTHCNAMSTVSARKERTTVIGGVAGETTAQAISRAAAIPDRRVQLVYPGASLVDDTGNLKAYAPYQVAAYVAGMHAGLPDPATSLVHARMPGVLDIETRLSTIAGGAVEQLLGAGVTPITPAPGLAGGFWVVDSLATYLADPDFRDFHKIRTADTVARRLRLRLEDKFVGGKSLEGTAGEIATEATAELNDQLTERLIRAFLKPTVAQSPTNSRAYLVQAPVSIPDTTKFILLTVALQPPGSVASGTAGA